MAVASIDDCKRLLEYRSSKNGGEGYISPSEFNLLWPRGELRYLERLYKRYDENQENSDALSRFVNTPATLTIDAYGKSNIPADLLHVDSMWVSYNGTTTEITEVQKDRVANNLSSSYDAPDLQFPIFTQYNTYFQFYPITLGSATLNYIGYPTPSVWGYYTVGYIKTVSITAAGTAYTNGTYLNVPLTGGFGTGALATIVVSGGIVTSVTITTPGKNYKSTDANLSATSASIGGTGTGFLASVNTLIAPRAVYDSTVSTQPLWNLTDIDNIVYEVLRDIGINMADPEIDRFANQSIQLER